ncbi:Protein transport protein sft2 [Elasticomyces elasticus]|nr:Protein transport protein sft2 [Elasticomyces elasticus]
MVSRWDRLLVFGGLNLAALALFVVCFTLMPILLLRSRKFAILWSMASALFLASWAVMMGPLTYVRHLLSTERLPFTATYFGSIALTLWFAVGLQSTLLTLISSIVQVVCLVWYLISYFPMGSTGLRFAARFGGNRAAAWLNG